MDQVGVPWLLLERWWLCLLQRVPFSPTDSSTILRKLVNDKNARAAEKTALRDLGGECGPILTVETAL
ncbi:unnamed protein product [Arabis nemorensis]|uniref:Uncharacterized protein n=1 Tax=Arabis nemorensis TaxID=586526 RepID=A0A565CM98_9BRAS|nr:unnamed protein product [Arabis nemorensis]